MRPVRLLASATEMPSSITFKMSWHFQKGPITLEMQKDQIPLQEGLSWETTDLITVPGKTVEQVFKAISKDSKSEKIWRTGNGELPKGNSAQLI